VAALGQAVFSRSAPAHWNLHGGTPKTNPNGIEETMSTSVESPFKISANSNEGGDFELPPSGTHCASLVALVDLGTHTREFNGEKTKQHRLFLVWELTNEADSKGQNFVVGQDYTWSLNKKAKLRGIVEGFLGRALTDGEDFDLLLMVGKPCVVTITDGVSGSGKKYANLSAVGKPMKGQTADAPTHEPFAFSLGSIYSSKDDLGVPSWMPPIYGRAIPDEIKKSHEYEALPAF